MVPRPRRAHGHPPTPNSIGGSPPLSRRRFLATTAATGGRALALSRFLQIAGSAGATAGLGTTLAACGDAPVAPTVVPLFSPDRVLAAGRLQRIPLALVAPDADRDPVALPPDDGEITVVIRLDDEEIDRVDVAGRVVEHDHVGEPDPDHQHANLFRYYPLRSTLPQPGIYDLTIEVAGTSTTLPIQAFDPSEISVPLPGERFPAVRTPTVEASDGVDPLCTRIEPCPFHTVSADDVLAAGRSLALLVATPAYCSTAYCGPVLETLVEASGAYPDLDIVHVEVYANPTEVDGNVLDPAIRLAPAVERLGLGFEPSLFLIDADGILADRIDNVFDRTELDEVLDTLAH